MAEWCMISHLTPFYSLIPGKTCLLPSAPVPHLGGQKSREHPADVLGSWKSVGHSEPKSEAKGGSGMLCKDVYFSVQGTGGPVPPR